MAFEAISWQALKESGPPLWVELNRQLARWATMLHAHTRVEVKHGAAGRLTLTGSRTALNMAAGEWATLPPANENRGYEVRARCVGGTATLEAGVLVVTVTNITVTLISDGQDWIQF